MGIVQGSTPDIKLKILDSSVDLTAADSIYVTIVQNDTKITKTDSAVVVVEGNIVTFHLTQQESLSLAAKLPAKIQVNWLYTDISGDVLRGATKARDIMIEDQLLPSVLT